MDAGEAVFNAGESFLDGKHLLVTGGTGSFGQRFIRTVLERTRVARVVVFSRDEFKQFEMAQKFQGDPRIRFFIGDVRDHGRLLRAFDGVHVVVHTAAMKQVPAVEYNPLEAIRTNINGAENVINAAMDMGVLKVIALSTDKASSPVNLYGATKLVSDKLFVFGNAYVGGNKTRFSVVRYGNVVGSRGSVVPLFLKRAAAGEDIPITHEEMTRFWITLDQGVQFVLNSLGRMAGGEIFVPKIPSMRMLDLAEAVAPGRPIRVIGIRPGEKLHEEMISASDSRLTMDMGSYYVIQPDTDWWRNRAHPVQGTMVAEGFSYCSDRNTQWLTPKELKDMIGIV